MPRLKLRRAQPLVADTPRIILGTYGELSVRAEFSMPAMPIANVSPAASIERDVAAVVDVRALKSAPMN